MDPDTPLPTDAYTAPEYEFDAFNCSHCGSYNEQTWHRSGTIFMAGGCGPPSSHLVGLVLAQCRRSHRYSVWLKENPPVRIYPQGSTAPRAHSDLLEEIAGDFEEARKIVGDSPKGGAALLRLATEKLAGGLIKKKTE